MIPDAIKELILFLFYLPRVLGVQFKIIDGRKYTLRNESDSFLKYCVWSIEDYEYDPDEPDFNEFVKQVREEWALRNRK